MFRPILPSLTYKTSKNFLLHFKHWDTVIKPVESKSSKLFMWRVRSLRRHRKGFDFFPNICSVVYNRLTDVKILSASVHVCTFMANYESWLLCSDSQSMKHGYLCWTKDWESSPLVSWLSASWCCWETGRSVSLLVQRNCPSFGSWSYSSLVIKW